MKRILISALALALLWSASAANADMYENSSNAKQPDAINNLTKAGIPAVGGPIVLTTGGSINLTASTVSPALQQNPGSMNLTGGGYLLNNWFGGGNAGAGAQWTLGSMAAPVTDWTKSAAVSIGMVSAVPNCGPALGCNSALLIQHIGTAAQGVVTNGITIYTETKSTAGLGDANAQGINSVAVANVASNAAGMAAYFDGRRYGAAGHIRGMELRATNASDTDCLPAEHTFISNCMGLWMSLAGKIGAGNPTTLISSAIQVGVPPNYNGGAREGLIFGIGSITEKTIADRTNSDTSIYVDGNHNVAFQTTGALAGKVLLGTPASYSGPGVSPFARAVQIYSGGVQIGTHGTDIDPAQLTFTKSRNTTVGSHTTVVDGDHLGQILFSGSDGTMYKNVAAMILGTVDGAVSAGIVPTKLTFWTSTSGGVSTERLAVTSDGTIKVTGSLTVNGVPVPTDNSVTAPRVVYYGDSLTNGGYDRYITLTKYKTGFTASGPTPIEKEFSTQRSGYGGMKADAGLTYAPEFLDPLYQSRSPLNIAMIWLGTNDISLAPQQTPATTWTRIQALATAAKTKGFKVCVGTMISRVSNDTNLTTLNGLITAGWAAAGINCLVNFASDPNLAPNGSNYANLTYYAADQVHLNEAGKQLAAAVAQTALNAYINTFTGPTIAAFNAPGNMTASGLPASAGGGGLYVCVDNIGLMYKKATCP